MTSELFSRFMNFIAGLIPSDHVLFIVRDREGKALFTSSRGMENGADQAFGAAVIGRALELDRPIFAPDRKKDRDTPAIGGENLNHLRGFLCVPWASEDSHLGAAYLARSDIREPFTEDNLKLLRLAITPVAFLTKKMIWTRPPEEAAKNETGSRDNPFLGRSPSAEHVRFMIEKVKDSKAPVFISGESGTGKELAARTIHEKGRRHSGPFVAVNCGAIPENLLESELFGHARGSFTGALRDKVGLIEEAHGGTFFLDEIGDLPPSLQAKLLRVLEEKKIRRVGENKIRSVDVRFISATNKNIEQEVRLGGFREDLYYRLKIIVIELPCLRKRREDIPLLLNHFLGEFSRASHPTRPFFSPRALELLVAYSWPGNVRELQNEVQRALIMAGDDCLVREDYLSPRINPQGDTYSVSCHDFQTARAEFEKRFLREALVRCDYHRTRTAAAIGLTRQGLFKLLKKHRMCPSPKKNSPRQGPRRIEAGR